MKHQLFVASMLFLGVAYHAPVCAENVTSLPQVVVTANKHEQEAENVAASVTVITRESIESQEATTVPEVLRNTPGINITSIGSPGDDTDVRLRGSARDEVLFLIDGVPMNTVREHRSLFLGTIPLDNVERIEIVRGSQSTLYGSDAVGGVINIITRKGTPDPRYFFRFEGGNLQYFKETAGLSGSPGKTRYSLTVSRTDQKGQFERDRFGEVAASGNIGRQLTPEVDLELGFNYIHSTQQLYYEFIPSFDPTTGTILVHIDPDLNRNLTRDLFTGRLVLKALPTPWWDLQFHYGLFLDFERLTNGMAGDTAPPGLAPGAQDFTGEGYTNTIDLRNFFTLYESTPFSTELLVGFEFQDERFNFKDPPLFFPLPNQQGNRQNLAPYIQATFYFLNESLIIAGGTRFDYNTSFGHELSPRASILYKLKKTGTTFRGVYAEGFHAPTILEFFSQTLLRDLNDPAFQAVRLQQELSQSYEAGIDQKIGRWADISATFFYIDYDRLFDELQFIADAFSMGVETEFSVRPIDELTIGGNYTFLRARDESNDAPLPNRPAHQFNAYVQAQPIKRLTIRGDVNVVSSRIIPNQISTSAGDIPFVFIDSNGTVSNGTLGGYTLVNLAATYHILQEKGCLKDWKAFFRIKNLLDRNYQERFGFPSPGITFLAGSQATF